MFSPLSAFQFASLYSSSSHLLLLFLLVISKHSRTQSSRYLDLSVSWQVKCFHFDNGQTTFCKCLDCIEYRIFSLLIENMFTLYCWHFTVWFFEWDAINMLSCGGDSKEGINVTSCFICSISCDRCMHVWTLEKWHFFSNSNRCSYFSLLKIICVCKDFDRRKGDSFET